MGMLMKPTTYLPITVIPTKTFQENYETIYMSSSLMKYWGIKPTEGIHLYIGNQAIKVTVEVKEVEKNHILMSDVLMASIPIPKMKYRLLSQYDHLKKRLYIGPIIAVVTEVTEREDGTPNFYSLTSFIEELHLTTLLAGGFLYVFRLKDFSKKEIEGWYYDGEGWRKQLIVPPNTIYNRIHSRKMEASSFTKKFMANLSTLKIPIFNHSFLSKWEVHQILHAEDILHPYLPDTSIFHEDTLYSFLAKHQSIFIKPINGSLGRNIYRLSKTDKKLVVKFSFKTEEIEFQTETEFLQWFQKRTGGANFIIQQGIPLITYEDCHLDFRVLCHKNYDGDWNTTSVVSRISAKDQFVSNLAKGGKLLSPTEPLSLMFDEKTVLSKLTFMKELSIKVAQIISQSSVGYIGELGIDIGMDTNGDIWIIEVNSKPSKNAEEQKSTIRPSAKAIFKYATQLSFQHLRQL